MAEFDSDKMLREVEAAIRNAAELLPAPVMDSDLLRILAVVVGGIIAHAPEPDAARRDFVRFLAAAITRHRRVLRRS
jgi:hypothetical protein